MNVDKKDTGIYECRVRYNGEDIVLTKVTFIVEVSEYTALSTLQSGLFKCGSLYNPSYRY